MLRRRLLLLIIALSGLHPLSARAESAVGYQQRLQEGREALVDDLSRACPKQRPVARRLLGGQSPADQRKLLERLARCGRKSERYHLQMGAAHFAAGDFAAAEASYDRALAIRVTEAGQASLLSALVRQKRTPRQEAKLREHLAYFRARDCVRDDLCASVAYVAWHLDEHLLTRTASERAIALGFPGWQPYFTGGTSYCVEPDPDPVRARKLLAEALSRQPPANVRTTIEAILGEDSAPVP